METGTKVALAFLGGVAVGAAALAVLNRGKLDFDHLKPMAADLFGKGADLKDSILKNVEDWAAEARAHAEQHKGAENAEAVVCGQAGTEKA